MASLAVYSDALPAEPRGGILAISTSGSYVAIVLTATKAYMLQSDLSWLNITRQTAGSDVNYNLAAGDSWSCTQYGDTVVCGNVNDAPQKFTLSSSTKMEALGGSPPQARYWGVQGDYLLGLSTASNPNRIHRSGLNNIEWWSYGLGRGSDYQDLPDGGPITGMAGSERGAVIFSRDSIRLFQDQPGSPVLFTLAKADPVRGAIAPHSIVNAGGAVYYLAESGFRVFSADGSFGVGEGRVDLTFLADCQDRTKVQGVYDPQLSNVIWRYTSSSAERKLIGYSPKHNRFFSVVEDVTFLIQAATVATSLEAISSVHGYTSLENVPFSLDSPVWQGGRPLLGAFNSSYELCIFNGSNLEATLETADNPLAGEGNRGYVTGFRPTGDAGGVTGQIGVRSVYHDDITWSLSRSQNATGLIPLRANGRTHRFRITIPAGAIWRHSIGVEPEGVRAAGRQ